MGSRTLERKRTRLNGETPVPIRSEEGLQACRMRLITRERIRMRVRSTCFDWMDPGQSLDSTRYSLMAMMEANARGRMPGEKCQGKEWEKG